MRTTKSKFNLGVVANCKNIFTLKRADIPGGPDGMTIDTDGNLWIAIFGGDRIIKIDPRKPETLLESIKLPAHQVNNSDVCSSCVKYNIFQVTSAAWGGPDLDQLYVTTAKLTTDGIEYPPPDHGATYVITGTGSKGLPAANFRL